MSDDPGEQSVIDAVLSARPSGAGRTTRIDAGDDAAVLLDGTVVTVDALVEGVHWDERASPGDVGWKAVAVSASDLGAMGCAPTWAVLTLSLPRPLQLDWVREFAAGLAEALAHFKVDLVGGDCTRSVGGVHVGITMGGRVAAPVARSGARPGDVVAVTGCLGRAALGFHHGGPALAWLHRPQPPVTFGVAAAATGTLTAMMDLSDGLARDLGRLCRASGVGATVETARLPLPSCVPATLDPVALGVAFGDDYELLLTTAPAHLAALSDLARAHDTTLTVVGSCTPELAVRLDDRDWPPPGFAHFHSDSS